MTLRKNYLILFWTYSNSSLSYLVSHRGMTASHHSWHSCLWLKVPERIEFKLAVLVWCLHQSAPPYLAEEFPLSSSDEARQRLRSASTSSLVVPRTRLSTIVDRAFPVAAARLWHTLSLNVTSASSISVFRKRLNTYFFSHSFLESLVLPVQWLCHFGHCSRCFYVLNFNSNSAWGPKCIRRPTSVQGLTG